MADEAYNAEEAAGKSAPDKTVQHHKRLSWSGLYMHDNVWDKPEAGDRYRRVYDWIQTLTNEPPPDRVEEEESLPQILVPGDRSRPTT